MVNLDDTRHCPIGPECEGCGRLDELAVVTGDTPHGIGCMTLCDACEVAGVDPIFTGRGYRPHSRARSARGRRRREMTGEGDLQPSPPPRWAGSHPALSAGSSWPRGGTRGRPPPRPPASPAPSAQEPTPHEPWGSV
jgi:hypothetical protein